MAEAKTWVRIVVLSNQAPDNGILLDDGIELAMPPAGSLADAALRELRELHIAIEPGDLLFFPEAASGHRAVKVVGTAVCTHCNNCWSVSKRVDAVVQCPRCGYHSQVKDEFAVRVQGWI